ncbi:hypothetical protein BGP_5414 [Beggiatoa sp. PS]|nr:hypothetical protein BGP_5414 [Beggiatoa sp. PS]
MGVKGSFTLSPPPWQVIIPVGPVPVPVYAKLSATVSGDGSVNFNMEPELFQFDSGKVDVGLEGRGAVGVGVASILGAEGFVKVGSNFIFVFVPQAQLDEIKGFAKAGIAVYALVFRWEPELPIKWEWSTKNTRSRVLRSAFPIEYPSKSQLMSRDYLNKI